jgi:hypothetical protein
MNSPDERASASMLASDETRRRENEKDWGSYKGREGKSEPRKRGQVPSPDTGLGRKSHRRKGGEAEPEERKRLPSSDNQRKGLGSYKGRQRKSEPEGRRRVPCPDKGLGCQSYQRETGESELEELKRLPSSDKQLKRTAADRRDESLKGRLPQPPDSPDEWASAFMHSERLRAEADQRDCLCFHCRSEGRATHRTGKNP